jgi:hypothetical protein
MIIKRGVDMKKYRLKKSEYEHVSRESLYKRIKTLESVMREYIETQQPHFPDCDIVTNSSFFREQFKQLLEENKTTD